MTTGAVLASLALIDDPARRALHWRGTPGVVRRDESLWVPAGGTLDLGTWLNSAPVAWWRRLLGPVRLQVRVDADGVVDLHTLDSAGRIRTTSETAAGPCLLPVPPDAQWCWLTLRAGASSGQLRAVTWVAPDVEPTTPAPLAVVIPTYGREADVTASVCSLLDPGLADLICQIVVIDQAGTLAADDGFGELMLRDPDRLHLLTQDNLGGSGGFARGMLHLNDHAGPVMLLDDDAAVEAETVRRMAVLTGLARRPTVLGTALLSADQPTMVHALAQRVRRQGFGWGPADGLTAPVDLSDGGPQQWAFANPGAPVDYVGWWCAVLPAGALRTIGLPAPYFLKWDDAEYGLRCRTLGWDLAVLPGTAAWHPTWAGATTRGGWTTQPLHRNRVVTAAAYGAGRSVLLASLAHQVKHLLSLQYATADLWDDALQQVAQGPGWLTDDWRHTRARAEAVVSAAEAMPSTTAGGRTTRTRAVPVETFHWTQALGQQAVVLTGSGVVLRRDRQRAARALRRTLRIHGALFRRWGRLRREYAPALAQSRSAGRWRSTLAAAGRRPVARAGPDR